MSDGNSEEQTVAVTAHVDSQQTTIDDENETSIPDKVAAEGTPLSLDSTVDTGESPPRYPSSFNTLENNQARLSNDTPALYESAFDTPVVAETLDKLSDFDPSSDRQETEDLRGYKLGGYILESLLDAGGMSRVFLAKHESLNRTAAIKVLSSSLIGDKTHKSRFLQEARIVNEVTHPNIVQIFDFIDTKDPPRLALVMEHLKGMSLAQALDTDHIFTEKQALRICFQVCDAIAAVHSRGIIHRDLKPGNIFLTGPLNSSFEYVPSVKVLDFGIAKALLGPESHATKTGITMGTPAYMAPEQIVGSAPTEKSDIYAISSILYELLTGERLFEGDMRAITQQKLINETFELETLSSLKYGDKLKNLIRRGLIKDPKSRPTAIEFIRELTEIAPSMFEKIRLSQTSFVNHAIPEQPSIQQPAVLGEPLIQRPEAHVPKEEKASKAVQYLLATAIVLTTVTVSAWMFPRNQITTVPNEAQPIVVPDVIEPARPSLLPVTRKVVQQIVRSSPAGAVVTNLENGKKLGKTPVIVELKTGGKLEVGMSMPGFRDQKITVDSQKAPSVVKLKRIAGLKTVKGKAKPKSDTKRKDLTPERVPSKSKKAFRRGELPGF